MYQLPNDVVNQGYKQTRPYHFEQVFFSSSLNFTGTEREFVQAGYGYKYAQIDPFTRFVVEA